MSRAENYFYERPKRKPIPPIWRGIGCLSVVIFTVGVYLLTGLVMKANLPYIGVPPDVGFSVGPIPLPFKGNQLDFVNGTPVSVYFSWIQLAFTGMADVVFYGVVFIVYSLVNPIKPGPKDAPPSRPRRGRRQTLIR
jgi:hypothetical protein